MRGLDGLPGSRIGAFNRSQSTQSATLTNARLGLSPKTSILCYKSESPANFKKETRIARLGQKGGMGPFGSIKTVGGDAFPRTGIGKPFPSSDFSQFVVIQYVRR